MEQSSRLAGRKTVSVHLQGSDTLSGLKKLETVNSHYPAVIEQATAKNYAVWLMTDYEPYINDYQARFGSSLVYQDVFRTRDHWINLTLNGSVNSKPSMYLWPLPVTGLSEMVLTIRPVL